MLTNKTCGDCNTSNCMAGLLNTACKGISCTAYFERWRIGSNVPEGAFSRVQDLTPQSSTETASKHPNLGGSGRGAPMNHNRCSGTGLNSGPWDVAAVNSPGLNSTSTVGAGDNSFYIGSFPHLSPDFEAGTMSSNVSGPNWACIECTWR